MLAIENAEIGGTLIALSVPGLKPLFGSWFIYLTGSESKSQSRSGVLSYPMQPMHGPQLRSGKHVVPASNTMIGAAGRNRSDDSLLGGLGIYVRKNLDVESQKADTWMLNPI